MSCNSLIYDNCYLLTNIDLNSQRICQLLERRFKSNSSITSFDFKLFLPEQPSNNTKITRSLLRCQPKIASIDNNENELSDTSSEEEEEEEEDRDDDDEETSPTNDDDYLDKLAEWEQEEFQPTTEETDDDDDENIPQSVSTENTDETNQMDISPTIDTPSAPAEDLFVTFTHVPIKTEPISDDDDDVFLNPPQLDGQMDIELRNSPTVQNQNATEKKLNDVVAKIRANIPKPHKTKSLPLRTLPTMKEKIFFNDQRQKKSITKPPKKPSSTPTKPEQIIKETKQLKKNQPYLLSSLKKNNEDTIRPFDSRLTLNQKSSPRSSDSFVKSPVFKQKEQRKSSTNISKSSMIKKQTILPENQSKIKEKSASDHMSLAQQKLNHFQKHQHLKTPNTSTESKSKENIKISLKSSKSLDSSIKKPKPKLKHSISIDHSQHLKKKSKKLKRLDKERTNTQLQIKHNQPKKQPSTVDKPLLNSYPSEPSIDTPTSDNKQSTDHFSGCIVIDDDDDEEEKKKQDDDILEIEHENPTISYDIRTREKLLDHTVHSSSMHVKWLINLEYLLLEHISICHEKSIRPLNKIYENNSISSQNESLINCQSYQIDPSFISIIIINFVKMFLLKNSSNDQKEISFIQFGITSHLRYLLIELPTYNHNEEKDFNDDCSKCHQYSLIINILFDLLFDLIEYDICEKKHLTKSRSSLIQDDYFMRFSQSKNSFNRIKLIIYFIELIGIHMNKCQKKKQFQFNQNENKFFYSIELFIRHILSHTNNLINERMGICFNVMELCLLFVNEKENRIKQMGLFLAELCEDNSNYLNLFLLEKNLLVDIRLLMISELISKKFSIRLCSIENIYEVFRQIQENFNMSNPIDDSLLLLVRSLFNTYADLIIEIKSVPLMYGSFAQQLVFILRNQLDLIYNKLNQVTKTERTIMLYYLLKCKWNKL